MTTRNEKLETLFRQHYRQMYRLAMVLLHDDAESKDIVHDVFAQLLASPTTELHEETAAALLVYLGRNTMPLFLYSPIFTFLCKPMVPILQFDPTGFLFLSVSLLICITGSLSIEWSMNRIGLSYL